MGGIVYRGRTYKAGRVEGGYLLAEVMSDKHQIQMQV